MPVTRSQTELVEELRLPAGGSYIITDEQGHELFRVTAVGDAVKVAGVAINAAALASGTQHAHIADLAVDANGTAIAAAVNAILDALEAFAIVAAA